MYIIDENIINEIVIKKSRFITLLYKIDNVECVKEILLNVKKEYKGANHYCHAYIVDNKEKCTDDGEPVGTAGIPILTTLRKENVTNILCIVVRYFGGIKLGSGGLIRGYSKSCKEAIQKTNLIELKKHCLILFQFDYSDTDKINYLFKDFNIISKNFDNKIIYEILITLDKFDEMKDALNNIGILLNKKDI